MDRRAILKLVLNNAEKDNIKYSEQDLELLDDIRQSIIEMEVARSLFDNVSDPQLIELAIHAEDTAKSRCNYLIGVAKKRALEKALKKID